MKQPHQNLLLRLMLCAGLFIGTTHAQDFSNIQVRTVPVADGIYMLMGRGGNIGVSVGPDGVLLIDDDYAPLNSKIVSAIAAITDRPVKLLLNTHWHGDHTGGNEKFAAAGALIIAHDNVRKRMSAEHVSSFFKSTTPASPAAALPVMTYDSNVTLHLNGQIIVAHHVPPAHTDGDSIVWFVQENVVHMGDLFFNGFYPFIDVDSGGSIRGMIAAVDHELKRIDADTRIIPGHGPLATRDDLVAYRNMLSTVTDRIAVALDKGMTTEQIIAARPAEEFDAEWGGGFIKPDQWVTLAIAAIQANP